MSIAVVGSINQDLILRVARHPGPGETVLAREHAEAAGGKGANQAVAAARLGRQVTMVGRVGDDTPGRRLVAGLQHEGVDVTNVAVDPGARTGLAVIALEEGGENTIVVSPGANGRLGVDDVAAAVDSLHDATVTLIQLEIPLEAVEAAAQTAGGMVVLNPAPARPLPAQLLATVDVLVPNRSELAMLAGVPEPRDVSEAASAVSALPLTTPVVVTLGADGALLVVDGATGHVPAPTVDVVDTTAAGDAFCGGLADALARGETLEAAVRWAVHAGAVAATRLGAQPSLPTAAQVRALGGGA